MRSIVHAACAASLLWWATVGTCVGAADPAGSGGTAADPIEGRWLGMAGFPQDRVQVGFEFKRGADGAIRAYLYEPVNNFYGLELPGVVEHSASGYSIASYVTSLHLVGHDDRLEGTYLPLNYPISLERTEVLPSEAELPVFPPAPEPTWRTKLGGGIYAPVAIDDGVAYVGTTGGTFNALRVADGSLAWAVAVGRPVYGEAAVSGDAVYFVCDSGFLVKLDRKDGRELWRYDLGGERAPRVLTAPTVFEWDYRSPRPVIVDGVIYVGSADGSFHAVDAATGKRAWRHEGEGGRIRADALVEGQQVIYGDFAGVLHALDRSNGHELWRRETGLFINAAPALASGLVIVANRGGLVAALHPEDGKTAWRTLLWGSAAESTAVAYGDDFYIGASDLRRITAYDAKGGRVLWRSDIYGTAWGRPVVTEQYVYASAVGYEPYQMRHVGGLTALDRRSGALLWRWTAPRGPDTYESGFAAGPTLSGESLVVGSVTGVVYCFPVGERARQAPQTRPAAPQ